MNNNIWALVFLIAGALLTTTALTSMVPAAYADDADAEDDSLAQQNDCDNNDVHGDDGGAFNGNDNRICENTVGSFSANDGPPP